MSNQNCSASSAASVVSTVSVCLFLSVAVGGCWMMHITALQTQHAVQKELARQGYVPDGWGGWKKPDQAEVKK